MANIGQIIENKYEILKRIGKGGMSEVYLAMDRNLNKQWAVKEIKKKARNKNNEVVIQSAIAEANMMKKLDHHASRPLSAPRTDTAGEGHCAR